MRGVGHALGRGRADCVHTHDRNYGSDQSGRNDDGDLAHLAIPIRDDVDFIGVTHEDAQGRIDAKFRESSQGSALFS